MLQDQVNSFTFGRTFALYRPVFLCAVTLLCPLLVTAQLAVTVTPPKINGQRAVVKLSLKNNFAVPVESARAVCFLLDDQGKMIGQSTKWVIGQNKIGLASSATSTFSFVIASPQPFTSTNLTAKVAFSRVLLDDGKPVDVRQSVNVTPTVKW